jgi:hypothetical protein
MGDISFTAGDFPASNIRCNRVETIFQYCFLAGPAPARNIVGTTQRRGSCWREHSASDRWGISRFALVDLTISTRAPPVDVTMIALIKRHFLFGMHIAIRLKYFFASK